MKSILVNLPEPYIEALNKLVRRKRYPNRNEAIRLAIRDLLHKEKIWNQILKRSVNLEI